MFWKSNYAINYTSWEFDFSVIRAWILEKAVENWNNLDVLLDYLWFFGCEWLNIQKELNVDWFKSTLKSLILCLYENKTWCFDDKYPNNNNWHKLNFQDNIYINRKTGWKNKFCIWEKNDSFRLVGIFNNGFYMFTKYFPVNEHDKYDDYLGETVSQWEKKQFFLNTKKQRS